MKRKSFTIALITSSRADFYLLEPVLRKLQTTAGCAVKILATGSHVARSRGATRAEIRAAGYSIDAEVSCLLDDDTDAGVCASAGLAVAGIGRVLAEWRPDLVLLLGDRFEILAACFAAKTCRLPVAHIAGGDVTLGSVDNCYRDAISALADLHFPTHEKARKRLAGMGISRVVLSGSPGIDRLKKAPRIGRDEFERRTGYRFRRRNVLATYHPSTASPGLATEECEAFLEALGGLPEDFGILFTGTNVDHESGAVRELIAAFCVSRSGVTFVESLGPLFHPALRLFDVVAGNSSSGLYEAPSFGVPTVNIGDRQNGRPCAASVTCVPAEPVAIRLALERAAGRRFPKCRNPYGDGRAADRIVSGIKTFLNGR